MRILAFFSLLLIPALTSAQTFGGIGARAEGMGGAFVAVADDASAVYWNPAGMATGAMFDFQVSGESRPAGSNLFFGASMPVLGLSFYRTHTVQGFPDRHNERSGKVPIRTLTTSNTGITVVQSVVSTLVIGSTVRLVHGGFDSFDERTTADVDAGVMWAAGGGFRLGIAGRNLREPEFETDFGPFRLERQARAGVAFAPRSPASGVHGPLTVAFDADLTETAEAAGGVRMAAFGAEYWLPGGSLGVRGGLRWPVAGEAQQAVSGGVTVKLPGSVFAEGQLTKPEEDADVQWTIGVRLTF
jgi:hypothetical protein